MRRIIDAIRRWWYSGSGQHERIWGDDIDFIDLSQAIIRRHPTLGRPPWETAPLPTVCLLPAYVPEPQQLHPFVQAAIEKNLGAASVNDFVLGLFQPVWAALPAA